jgi:alkylation response protein AidB-like acyl-CoA dehydrogenase
MQLRLNVRRIEMGARCIGMARRALSLMIGHVKERTTFGQKLADRQAIQWWIADGATKVHACRLMVHEAARTMDQGGDVRGEASMIKVFSTEMATEIIDQAMQSFGAMGMTKELPLQQLANMIRVMRIYEGPTEVHRMSLAKRVLREGI